MSHHRYQTTALVLGSIPIGESNRFIDLFTEDLGYIRAAARSVREERSKLRFSLQDFSLSDVSLVRGKEVWRLVGAEHRRNFFSELDGREKERELMVRLLSLSRRLLGGEEENKVLFDTITGSLRFLAETELDEEARSNFECLSVLRMLYHLGYLAKNEHLAELLDTQEVSLNIVSLLSPMRFELVKQINTSLQETQL